MALIKCPECGNEFSIFADFCPKCGCTIKNILLQKKMVDFDSGLYSDFFCRRYWGESTFKHSIPLNDKAICVRYEEGECLLEFIKGDKGDFDFLRLLFKSFEFEINCNFLFCDEKNEYGLIFDVNGIFDSTVYDDEYGSDEETNPVSYFIDEKGVNDLKSIIYSKEPFIKSVKQIKNNKIIEMADQNSKMKLISIFKTSGQRKIGDDYYGAIGQLDIFVSESNDFYIGLELTIADGDAVETGYYDPETGEPEFKSWEILSTTRSIVRFDDLLKIKNYLEFAERMLLLNELEKK